MNLWIGARWLKLTIGIKQINHNNLRKIHNKHNNKHLSKIGVINNNVVDIEVGVEEEVILTGTMEEVGAVINKTVVQVKV